MKTLVFSIIVGSVLLYFFNIALLKTPLLDLDWSFHAALRFSAGFFILGVSYFYAKALTFKNALYITVCILIADYIYDYNIAVYRLNFEIILHGIYMLIWGALLGYLTARYIKEKSNHTS
jgi:hypothetical protein